MIKSFIKQNQTIFRIVLMALIGLIILFNFISLFGSYSKSASSNFATTLDFIVYNGLLGLLLFCLITKKDNYTRALSFVYLTYFVMSTILSIENPFWYFYDGAHGTLVSEYVFQLIAITAFVAFVVLKLISDFKGIEFKVVKDLTVMDILVFVYIFFEFLAWCLQLAYYSVMKSSWVSVMSSFNSRLFMPFLVVIGYFLYQIRFVDAPQDEAYESFDAPADEAPAPAKKTTKKAQKPADDVQETPAE